MITRFTVKNFKNFKNELILDLTKSRDYGFNDNLIINGCINKLLIYGPNNSGKSNLGAALMDITTHLTSNFGHENALYNYYANGYFRNNPVEFKYEFLLAGQKIVYKYTKDDNRKLLSEELYASDDLLLRYNYQTNEYENNIPEAKDLDLGKRNNDVAVLRYIYGLSLFWPETSAVKLLIDFVDNMLWFRSLRTNEFMGLMANGESLDDFILNNKLLSKFNSFLRACGQEYDLCSTNSGGKQVIGVKYNNSVAVFNTVASTGTLSLWLFFYWMNRVKNISFVYLDEFDAFYHFELANTILNMVNKESFQSIITTHNTYLCDNEIMRPDCYAILNNGKIQTLADSTLKTIRQGHNLEKMMRSGEFER